MDGRCKLITEKGFELKSVMKDLITENGFEPKSVMAGL